VARTYKRTRPELRRQRERLRRYLRYLPLLELKQQQLQLRRAELLHARDAAVAALAEIEEVLSRSRSLLEGAAGIDLARLARPSAVATSTVNVAGVALPLLGRIDFPTADYSLFGTPAWVDRALGDLREAARRRLARDNAERQVELLTAELTKVIQRVNLFEKVMIPQAREAIRLIRIQLGDEMAAGVGRAKIAKAKIVAASRAIHVRERDSAGGAA
jgi:V/A-type H+-transporting ATPase subunit D